MKAAPVNAFQLVAPRMLDNTSGCYEAFMLSKTSWHNWSGVTTRMKVLCLSAGIFCLVFAGLVFYVEGNVVTGFLLAFLALLFASAAISKDSTVRRVLLWFFSHLRP
jgi:hypothetical protein